MIGPLFCAMFLSVLLSGLAAGQAIGPSRPEAPPSVVELDRYYDEQIRQADEERKASWRRDFSSIEAYEKSVSEHREKLWDVLGGRPKELKPVAAREELIKQFDTHAAYRV